MSITHLNRVQLLLYVFICGSNGRITVTSSTLNSEVLYHTETKLTCTFSGSNLDKLHAVWRNSHGAKIGNPSLGGYSHTDTFTSNRQTVLTIAKENVESSTSYKCELEPNSGEDGDPTTLPSPLKLDVYVYTIDGDDQATIKGTSVIFKCKFNFIRNDPDKIFWKVDNGIEIESTSSEEYYKVDEANSGAIRYSFDSRTLTTTLSVDGSAAKIDTTYTCAIQDSAGSKKIDLQLDVFDVATEYVEVISRTKVTISCVFTNAQKELDVYWMLGKGGARFNKDNGQGYTLANNYAGGVQTSSLIISADVNAYTADYYCSVLDHHHHRDKLVKVTTFEITPVDKVYQVNITVTLSCVVSALRHKLDSVVWLDKDNQSYTSSGSGKYVIIDGTFDAEKKEQTTTFAIPAEMNTGDAAYRCEVTPTDTGGDGVTTRIIPGVKTVKLHKLVNNGYQCNVAIIRSLQSEGKKDSDGKNIPIPCFEILSTSTIYPVYDTQQYVAEGNNLEVKPLPIFEKIFNNNFVYRCKGASGWDRSPPSCSYESLKSTIPGACSTKGLFHPVIYKINSPLDMEIFSEKYNPDYSASTDPPLYYSYVEDGTSINYTIANTECYRFSKENAEKSFVTTCTNGSFVPSIEPVNKICCSYPKISFILNSDSSGFCVEPVPMVSNGMQVDALSKTKYIKDGVTVRFDKKCPCYSLDLDNVTCSEGHYHSNYWNLTSSVSDYKGDTITVDGKVQMKLGEVFTLSKYCCKLPDTSVVEGYPLSNYPGVQYVTLGTVVSYTCSGFCYLIKTGPVTCTVDTPTLEMPFCKRNQYCCLDANYTNNFLESDKTMLWKVTQNGKRQHYPYGSDETLATRKCVQGIWDLVKYKTPNVTVDDELIRHAMAKIGEQNCSVLVNLASLNLSETHYSQVLKQFYDHSFSLSNSSVTTKEEKEYCYKTLRYIMWDYVGNKYLHALEQVGKNQVVIATAKVLNEWVKLMSGSIKAVYTYGAVKIKPKAAALSGSRLIFSGWMIELIASSYADSTLMYAFPNLLFPNTKRSNIISPIVWVDLPQNASLKDSFQYIRVNFQYSRPLNPHRHYHCAVYDIGTWFGGDLNISSVKVDDARWDRGSCSNISVSLDERTVSCTCTEWKLYVAVTETFNTTSNSFAVFLVGNSSTEIFLQASNVVHAVAIIPIALTFMLLIKADTKRKQLLQCRLQICFGTVGSHLLSLMSYWMKPANVSCVYIMYLYDAFSIATMCWFCVEFLCLTKFIVAASNKEKVPGKKFSFKFVPVIFAISLLTPTGFVAAYKGMGLTDGTREFVEPFDSQKCWFNYDMEFYQYFAPTFLFAVIALVGLVTTAVYSIKEKAMKMDVAASGIVYIVVTLKNLAFFFRGLESIRILSLAIEATQSIVLLVSYVGMSIDVKKSLFPGFYAVDTPEDKKKLVGH